MSVSDERTATRDLLRIAVKLQRQERKRPPLRVERIRAGRWTTDAPTWPKGRARRHPNGGEGTFRYDGLFNAPFLRWPDWLIRTHNRFRRGREGQYIMLDGAAYLDKPVDDGTGPEGTQEHRQQREAREWERLYGEGDDPDKRAQRRPRFRVESEYNGQKSLDDETKGGWTYDVADTGIDVGLGGQSDPEQTADDGGSVFDAEARQLRREAYDDQLHEGLQRSIDALPPDQRALVRRWATVLPESYRRALRQEDIAALFGVSQSTVSRRLDEALGKLSGKLKKRLLVAKLSAARAYAEAEGSGRA